jgi:hypothetical protein
MFKQKKKWTFDEWYAKYGDGLPFVPESTYPKHRRHLVQRVSWAMRDFDFEDGHSPCVMFGAGYFRAGRYRHKCDYSHAVLCRFIRMKKLTILNYEDRDQLFRFVFSKRRPNWHNFEYLSRWFYFLPMHDKNMMLGAHVGGVRIDALSIEKVGKIEKLRAVGEKLDKIFSQSGMASGTQRARKQAIRQERRHQS